MGKGRDRITDLSLVLGLAAIALLLRLFHIDEVIGNGGDGGLWIYPDDPPYHLRRALMTVAAWPRVATFDPFVNFPDGATIYWPPGMAWLLAGLAKLLAHNPLDRALVEGIAVWIPPLVGALTVTLVYAACRSPFGRPLAFLVAVMLAVMPAHVLYTLAGRYDHHPFEPLLCWTLLWSLWRGALCQGWRRRGWILLGAASIGLAMATWPGILLHLGVVVVVVFLAMLYLEAGQQLARVTAGVFGCSLVLSAPIVALSPWSTQVVFFAPSLLHVACLGAACLAGALVGWPVSLLRGRTHRTRVAMVGGASVVALGAVLWLSETVTQGVGYATGSGLAVFSEEARSLFESNPANQVGWPALLSVALCAALVVALFARRRSTAADSGQPAPPVFLIAVAGVLLLVPALVEKRWLVAWSPFGAASVAVVWRLALAPLGRRLGQSPRRWAVWGLLGLVGLVTPALLEALLPPVPYSAHRAGESFLRRVRRLTPPAAPDEYNPEARPSYGVLTTWSIGHLFTHLAGRPTLASNFWGIPGHDRANRAALRLFLTPDCEAVAAEMSRLKLRYVLISPVDPRKMLHNAHQVGMGQLRWLVDERNRLRPEAARLFVLRLGLRDGEDFVLPRGDVPVPACGRFRLVAEAVLRPGPISEPGHFKLYERVTGARLETACAPKTLVRATLPLVTERGRRLAWSSSVECSASGSVRMRLPYPTDGSWGPVKVAARYYRVQLGEARVASVPVSAAATRTGQRLVLVRKP